MERYIEHRDMNSKYVLWVLDDASHVVFLHKHVLNEIQYANRTFLQWLMEKPVEECCKMIARMFLANLKYKPDYIIIVADEDNGAPLASGYAMETILTMAKDNPTLESIKTLILERNIIGHTLTDMCCSLANRGFFNDPQNMKKYAVRL
jgi:hypothetical protein